MNNAAIQRSLSCRGTRHLGRRSPDPSCVGVTAHAGYLLTVEWQLHRPWEALESHLQREH